MVASLHEEPGKLLQCERLRRPQLTLNLCYVMGVLVSYCCLLLLSLLLGVTSTHWCALLCVLQQKV